MKEIVLGRGMIDVCAIGNCGKWGVLIRERRNFIPVNTPLGPQATTKYEERDGDIIIKFENEDGARVFQDTVAQAILLMREYVPMWPKMPIEYAIGNRRMCC